jgi:DNA replication protein DnaC
MRSRKKNPENDLTSQLRFLGLDTTAAQLDDLLSRAIKDRWSPRSLLEEVTRTEVAALTQRSLERRLRQAQLGRFKPMADFDWNWPKKIDRDLVERALTLDFIPEARNFILIGNNGLGKTMITKNIAYAAVQAGYSVLMRTASDLLADLAGDSPLLRRRKFNFYARPDLLCIDEVGYLNYDAQAADLLYEVINRRYERRSLLITTNRVFKEWNQVFPNSSSITTLLDRLTHHADVTVLEGPSYRLRESELESAARRKSKARR